MESEMTEMAVVPKVHRAEININASTLALKNFFELVRLNNIQEIVIRFTDLHGRWQHFSVPIAEFGRTEKDATIFQHGIGYDGSSIRGFQEIHESDMLLFPDPKTAVLDPFMPNTITMIGITADPETLSMYLKDPRNIAIKAFAYMKSLGIADEAFFGPELEFFILDSVRYSVNAQSSFHEIDSEEAPWNSGKPENGTSHKIRHKEGYFPTPPMDTMHALRSEITRYLQSVGISVEYHHHEVATGGQNEIDMKFASLLSMADKVMFYKYIVTNAAHKNGKIATFMPKVLYGDNGSGMHVHQSLWKDGKNLFYDPNGYAGLSQMALWYIGGILRHAPALCAFIAPTTNSYRRLVPGFEAPVNLVYSRRNRSAAIRIPTYSKSEKATRIEFRTPDPMANPYLSFSAMLLAGIDGIINKIDPGKPFDGNAYEHKGELKLPSVPSSLYESLDALEADHEFLTATGVFPKELITAWIGMKRKEADEVRLSIPPKEFELYVSG